MIIIPALEDEPKRFGEIKRWFGDVAQSVLTENLRGPQRDGYPTHSVDPGPPATVTYGITTPGRSLLEIPKFLVFWSHEKMNEVKTARLDYDRGQKGWQFSFSWCE